MSQLKKNSIRLIHEKCLIEGTDHVFVIIRGSGRKEGTPTWKCARCKRIVKSS